VPPGERKEGEPLITEGTKVLFFLGFAPLAPLVADIGRRSSVIKLNQVVAFR